MSKNLVIVESPAKAKTIEKYLGSDFVVKSSYGHVRDLPKSKLNIDVENHFTPNYEISDDKKKIITELKKAVKEAEVVWLASDEDREGEAIAWHLKEALKLKDEQTKRIVFNEITKTAILNAIESPRDIDINLVDAQQARRILDRLVGYEISPILWTKIRPSLSAGRVQSVSVRLIVEKEEEINNFKSTSFFRIVGIFDIPNDSKKLKAELSKRLTDKDEALKFLEDCKNAAFSVKAVEKKPAKKSPAPPFTTSTLQQEANRKLGFSVSRTMQVAQQLYEAGHITYMRTDSVNLSDSAIGMASAYIKNEMGEKYVKIRRYKTSSKGAQEAHEAIRPTYMDKPSIAGNNSEQRLYDLIYKRTIASQMADALIEKTTVTISTSNSDKKFIATGEIIQFDGFLKVYIESSDTEKEDDENVGFLPPMKSGNSLDLNIMEARERWSQKPPRYSEASLVRKLEELGIGRPSTYAPTISTIQQRGYVLKEDRFGELRKYQYIALEKGKISQSEKTETVGAERSKLFPTDIGMVVNDFLVKYFPNVVGYDFTAKVEKEFDHIAIGEIEWRKAINDFYVPFHKQVEDTLEKSDRNTGERVLGNDPKTGKPVSVRIGRYGPMAQIGDGNSEDDKPLFASLTRGQHIETITIEEALKLFELPRDLGLYEDKKVVAGIGRFGPYVRHDGKFTSLKKGIDDPLEISLDRAIELIEEKREKDNKKLIKSFVEEPELLILNGRWGAYISYKGNNYKIPKGKEADKLTFETVMALINENGKSTAEKTKSAKAKTSNAKTIKASGTKKKTTVKKKVPVKKTSTKK